MFVLLIIGAVLILVASGVILYIKSLENEEDLEYLHKQEKARDAMRRF